MVLDYKKKVLVKRAPFYNWYDLELFEQIFDLQCQH